FFAIKYLDGNRWYRNENDIEDLKKKVEDDSVKQQKDIKALKKKVEVEAVTEMLEKLEFLENKKTKIIDQAMELDKWIVDIQNRLKDRMAFYTGLYAFLFPKGLLCSEWTDYVVTLIFCLVEASLLSVFTVKELRDIFNKHSILKAQNKKLQTGGTTVKSELLVLSNIEERVHRGRGRPINMSRIDTLDKAMEVELKFKSCYLLFSLLPFVSFVLCSGFGYFGSSP
ncbi:hypothetical protein FRX31_011480, partial [Thalictrum thalictroides]